MSYTRPDLALDNQHLVTDRTLRTAVVISLLSWGRAHAGDDLPDQTDLKGWWGDSYPDVPGDEFGSRLWTLWGKPMPSALTLAPDIAREALEWMIADGLATAVDATAEPLSARVLGLRVTITRGGQLVTFADPVQLVLG